MAAGGYKEFVAGETLDQDEINDYLMQGMLVFAGTAARGSAIGTPVEGQFSYLSDSDAVEFYDGSAWTPLSSGVGAAVISGTTGSPTVGTVTSGGTTYNVYSFTGDGSITVDTAGFAELLLVGGGGGGGQYYGGGGGAGGMLPISNAYIPAGTVTVTIGAGGAGATQYLTASGSPGHGGGASSIANYFATGGGGGGNATSRVNVTNNYVGTPGGEGGSGGGAGGHNGVGTRSTEVGAGIPGQGNDGAYEQFLAGTGGGGAGAAGGQGSSQVGGDGGDGLSNSITGSAVTYAGGGGGNGNSGHGTGGAGGGGNGGATPTNGTDGLGGGAGGGPGISPYGADGGSGIVIVRVAV